MATVKAEMILGDLERMKGVYLGEQGLATNDQIEALARAIELRELEKRRRELLAEIGDRPDFISAFAGIGLLVGRLGNLQQLSPDDRERLSQINTVLQEVTAAIPNQQGISNTLAAMDAAHTTLQFQINALLGKKKEGEEGAE